MNKLNKIMLKNRKDFGNIVQQQSHNQRNKENFISKYQSKRIIVLNHLYNNYKFVNVKQKKLNKKKSKK